MSNNRNRNRSRTYTEQRSDAAGQPRQRIKIQFEGHTYSFPHPDDWSMDDLVLMAECEDSHFKAILLVKSLLGSQWEPFKTRNKNSGKKLGEFLNEVLEVIQEMNGGEDSPN
ncbi:hypothetical protein ACFQS3_02660 [Glycomyces mayteni]|uniref:Uncharacterized protein n=1 Tax=Glycomyces mayteni TaxID=543887 RepID=A0ABW2D3R1_9ACTN